MAKRKKKEKKKDPKQVTDFAALLELPERLAQYLRLLFHVNKVDWDFMVDKVRQGSPYKEWSKSKGKGRGRRYFAAPCEELKKVQRGLLNQFLLQIPVHFSRHGGVKGSSILTNAEHHIGFAKTVFAIDIVDAFPNVYRSRIRACLKKPFEFRLRQFAGIEITDEDKKQLLETIVDLLAYKDRLPQGPPTSPRIFEIVSGKTDTELFDLVQTNSNAFQGYRLSIYADNITISSDGDTPEEFRKGVVKIIQSNGFHTHTRKDKMTYFSPQTGTVPVITGLVIPEDGRLLMHPNKVNQFRGALHTLLKNPNWDETEKGKVAGITGFIRQIYPLGKNVPSKLKKVLEEAEKRFEISRAKRAKTAQSKKKQEVKTSETKPSNAVIVKITKAAGGKGSDGKVKDLAVISTTRT